MGMNMIKDKRYYSRFLSRGADNFEPRDARQSIRRVSEKILFMGNHLFPVYSSEIIDGRTQSDSSGDMRRSRFEFVRQNIVVSLLEGHEANHVTAPLIR